MVNDLISRLAGWLDSNPLHAFGLGRAVPLRLVHVPPAADPGDPRVGHEIASGVLVCAGHKFDARQPAWFDETADRAAIEAMHAFAYLSDLAAAGDAGRDCARNLILSWIGNDSRPHEIAWAPDVLGARIAGWLSHARLLSGVDGTLSEEIAQSLSQQVGHLGRCVTSGRNGIARLIAIRGLIYGASCGFGSARLLNRGIACLRRALSHQILEDGIHIERSPVAQARALALLLDIHAMMDAAGIQVPAELRDGIQRLAPMLRFFRHGDRKLALFNGATGGDPQKLDRLLAQSRSTTPPPLAARKSGFQRAVAGPVLILQDAGLPPPTGFDTEAHAGCLAFEMSDGLDRIIVNCGHSQGRLHDALRATAAHSTLIVEDVNSVEVLPGYGLGRRPTEAHAMREDMDGSVWITASHNGYRERFGLVHRRRLYLAAGGDNVRGEDALVPDRLHEPAPHHFTIRFHLHPDVQASLLQSGAAVLLRLRSGAGWRFQTDGVPHLEESVYCSDGDVGRRTQQIVITAATDATGAAVKWAFQRVPLSATKDSDPARNIMS